jgi:hypothetical protein
MGARSIGRRCDTGSARRTPGAGSASAGGSPSGRRRPAQCRSATRANRSRASAPARGHLTPGAIDCATGANRSRASSPTRCGRVDSRRTRFPARATNCECANQRETGCESSERSWRHLVLPQHERDRGPEACRIRRSGVKKLRVRWQLLASGHLARRAKPTRERGPR